MGDVRLKLWSPENESRRPWN
jgi:two-component sensor histidine kinase